MAEIVYVREHDHEALREALLAHGPLSIGIDATALGFRFYSAGVLRTDDCGLGPDTIDHAVLLVGYGISDSAQRHPDSPPLAPQLAYDSCVLQLAWQGAASAALTRVTILRGRGTNAVVAPSFAVGTAVRTEEAQSSRAWQNDERCSNLVWEHVARGDCFTGQPLIPS